MISINANSTGLAVYIINSRGPRIMVAGDAGDVDRAKSNARSSECFDSTGFAGHTRNPRNAVDDNLLRE